MELTPLSPDSGKLRRVNQRYKEMAHFFVSWVYISSQIFILARIRLNFAAEHQSNR
jgi:hypothetical protein